MRNLMRGLERVILLVILTVLPARADWVTIRIEGTVDSVDDSGNYLEGKVDLGDTIAGWYTYDSTTQDSLPEIYFGDYWHYKAPAGVSLALDGFVFETDFSNVKFLMAVNNDRGPGDAYEFISNNNIPLATGTPVDSIFWGLSDNTHTVFSSDALPTTPPNLNQFQYNHLQIISFDRFYIDAHVTSAIPEPATLFLLGLGGSTIFRRRNRLLAGNR
jgi:hypothetical protein